MTDDRLRELEAIATVKFRSPEQQDELADAAPELIRMVRKYQFLALVAKLEPVAPSDLYAKADALMCSDAQALAMHMLFDEGLLQRDSQFHICLARRA